jgi:hypothetical protein
MLRQRWRYYDHVTRSTGDNDEFRGRETNDDLVRHS